MKPKLGGKGRGREKIKIIVPFRSKSMRNRKFQKNSKKIQKIKKYHYGVISSQKRLEKAQREKIKIIVSFRSVPTQRLRKIKNKIAKKFKKLKDTVMASFQAKIGWRRPRKRKNENCLSIPVLPDG